MRAKCPTHLNLFDFIDLRMCGQNWKSWSLRWLLNHNLLLTDVADMKHVCQRVCTNNKKLFTNLNFSKDLQYKHWYSMENLHVCRIGAGGGGGICVIFAGPIRGRSVARFTKHHNGFRLRHNRFSDNRFWKVGPSHCSNLLCIRYCVMMRPSEKKKRGGERVGMPAFEVSVVCLLSYFWPCRSCLYRPAQSSCRQQSWSEFIKYSCEMDGWTTEKERRVVHRRGRDRAGGRCGCFRSMGFSL
jgi:hypothetical protein